MQVDLVLVVLSGGAAVAGCSRSCLGIGWHQIGSAGVEQRHGRQAACVRASSAAGCAAAAAAGVASGLEAAMQRWIGRYHCVGGRDWGLEKRDV
jgi:dissimilatory sulfite reductase (desulfoviridin) alpha/beta subunit